MHSMGRLMDWTVEITWLTVCSSASHLQAAEAAVPHLCKQERKRPTPVRRRLRRTHAVLARAIPRGWVPMLGLEVPSLVSVLRPPRIPSVIRPERRTYVVRWVQMGVSI